MKKVLLMGDSIRMGYQGFVSELLKGSAEVVAPEENGRFAKYTLWGVNLWIKELGVPDIVHWNNGLWDIHREAPMTDALTGLGEYVETLRRTLAEIRRYKAAVIFATTTPVAEGLSGRSNTGIDKYNRAAVKLMKAKKVEVNDLNSLLRGDLAENISVDQLHLSEAGSRRCADKIAAVIRKYL